MLVDAELPRRHRGASARLVCVRMIGPGNAVFAQHAQRLRYRLVIPRHRPALDTGPPAAAYAASSVVLAQISRQVSAAHR